MIYSRQPPKTPGNAGGSPASSWKMRASSPRTRQKTRFSEVASRF